MTGEALFFLILNFETWKSAEDERNEILVPYVFEKISRAFIFPF